MPLNGEPALLKARLMKRCIKTRIVLHATVYKWTWHDAFVALWKVTNLVILLRNIITILHCIYIQHFGNFVYLEVNDNRKAPQTKHEPEQYDMHPFVSLSIPFDFQDLYQPIQSNNDAITGVELNQKDNSPITKEGMRGYLIRVISGSHPC